MVIKQMKSIHWPAGRKDQTMEDRLTELEIKTSLTEDLLEELNRTVYRQQQQLDLLQEQLRVLYGQMQSHACLLYTSRCV